MRTFAHFPTDDREHRLLRLAGEVPEPAETPEAPALPETVDMPVDTPEAVDTEAVGAVDAANVDVDAAATQIDAATPPVDAPEAAAVNEQPDVQLSQEQLNAALNGTADLMQDTGTAIKQGADWAAEQIRSFRGETPANEVIPDPPSDNDPQSVGETPVAEPYVAPEDWKPEDISAEEEQGLPPVDAQVPTPESPANPEGQVNPEDISAEEEQGLPPVESTDGVPPPPESAAYNEFMDILESGMPLRDAEGNPVPVPPFPEGPATETPAGETPATETPPVDAPKPTEDSPANPDNLPATETPAGETPTEGQPESTETVKPGNETTTEASESKETASESYEREKVEQRESREDRKLSDVSGGNPDQWSSIDNGKTDGTGKPFLYKEGTRTVNGQEQRVLLAYSPNGGVQVMDVNTHEWKFMNQMTPEERAQIDGADGMTPEAHTAALAAEKTEDPDAFEGRMKQNERNFTMEEDCLKSKAATVEWFRAHQNDAFWEGNENVRDALAKSLEAPAGETPANEPADATETPPEATDTPPDATDTPADANETKEEDPEMAELKKEIAELKKAVQDLTDRITVLEGGEKETEDAGEKDEDAGKEDAEKDEDAEKKNEAVAEAEKVLENPDSTAAERAEAVKTITDAALDAAEGKTATGEKPAEATTDTPEGTEVKEATELKESALDDKQLRAKLMGEVRNDPRKSVDEVKSAKTDAYEKSKGEMTDIVDADETAIGEQDKKVDGIKAEIMDKEVELALTETPEDEARIQGEIDALETEQSTEEGNLTKLEENRTKNVENLRTLKKNFDRETAMLDKLEGEWETTAKRADARFDAMGAQLKDLGQGDMGTLVEGITVKHDGSLGLEISLDASLVEKIKEFLPETKDKEDLGKNDNPTPAIKGIGAFIASLEAQAEKPAAPAPAPETAAPAAPEPAPLVNDEASRLASIRPSQNFRFDPGKA